MKKLKNQMDKFQHSKLIVDKKDYQIKKFTDSRSTVNFADQIQTENQNTIAREREKESEMEMMN